MSDPQSCAECGAELPGYWPKGLCTPCALVGALGMSHANSHVNPGENAKTSSRPEATRIEPEPLQAFGEYDLIEEIARGGMGVVYKARQRNLGRIVAVKMILAGPLAGKEFVRRFRSEAAAAAILQHPNIVAIHEVGVHDGHHYFSMDYVEGPNLAQFTGQRPLPAAKAARCMHRIAEAIHYAHERGILHRDLKPSNVLIDKDEQPHITDFGLAKRLPGSTAGTDYLSLTLSGQVLGSPNFMPPEQAGAHCGKGGRPSDVYGLGGMLFYMLTGRAPFQGESLEHTINQVLHADPVAPRLLNPSIPRDLETITLKCLEKEPSRRYQTAQEVADELGRVLRQEPIRARPANAAERLLRWCRRKPALAGALGLAAAALLTGLATTLWQWRQAEHERLATRHHLYVANMNLVQHRSEQNQMSRVRELLEETATAPERGFEWYYWVRQLHLGLASLRGHRGPILAVAYSTDGKWISTGSADHTARVWNADTGQEVIRLEAHTAPIRSIAFSPDSQRIVTGSWDRTAKIWDASSGRCLLTLKGHEAAIFSVAFSPDGQRIVTGSQDQTAKVWDASTGTTLLTFTGHTDRVWAVAFSLDGQRILSGGWDQTAKLWDAVTGLERRTFSGHTGAVFSVAFSPDGRRVVTGGQDHRARVWDANDGATLHTLKGHGAAVFSVGFSKDGTRIFTAGEDQTARLWDADSGGELRVIKGHGSRIGSAALSPDGRRLVTGGGAVRFSPGGQFFDPSTGDDQTAKVWDADDNQEVLTLKGHQAEVTSVDFSPDGRLVVSGSFDGTARIWDVHSGEEISSVRAHGDAIRAVAFLPDGKRFVTGSFDRTAKVWEVASGREVTTLEGHTAPIFSVAVSPDGRWIATGSWDRRVKLWDAVTGGNVHTFPDQEGFHYSVVFSPDGRRLLSASGDGPVTVILWEVASRKALFGFQSAEKVWSASFSKDGRSIVTGSHDLTARVWDAGTGRLQLILKGHTGHIHAAAFSPDGRRIVTGSADQTARLWDVATGKELLTLRGHTGSIFSARFSPDGRRIVTASGDGTIKVWEAASMEQVATWNQEEPPAASH